MRWVFSSTDGSAMAMPKGRNKRSIDRQIAQQVANLLDLSDFRSEDIIAEDVLHPAFGRIMQMVHADSGLVCLGAGPGQPGQIKYSMRLKDEALDDYCRHPEWSRLSLAGIAMRSDEPMIAACQAMHQYLEAGLLTRKGAACAAALPLRIRKRTLGVIVVFRHTRRNFSKQEIELMKAVSGQLAVTLENANLFEILHRGKTEWEKTFDAIQDLVAILDTEARLVRINRAFAYWLRTQPRHLIGKNYYRAFYGSSDMPSQCPVQQTLRTHNPHTEEIENPHLRSIFLVSTSPLTSRLGEFVGTVVMAQDIGERKRLEREVRRHRDYLSNILLNSPDAIVTTDLEGHIKEFNRSAENMTGYTRDEILDRDCLELFPSAADRERLQEHMTSHSQISSFGTQVLTKSGGQVEISLTLSYLTDEAGAPAGTVSIWKDITEWNHLQRQLIQAEKLSALGELVSGVAHELNNPLTAIMGYAELLLETTLDEAVQADVEKMHAQGARMLKIVQNLLRFARKYAPEQAPIDLNTVLRSTLELKIYEMRIDNITVVEKLSADLPSIIGDANQLQQVFLNIINNAHQAMRDSQKHGTLIISTSHEDGMARVRLSDTGPGIAKENISKIFDPFFTTKPVGKGTGLGLSVSFGIVKQHGGNIYAESRVGSGTTFTVDLPIFTD